MMLSNGKVAKMPDKKLTDNKIYDIKDLLAYKAKVNCQNCDMIGKGCCSTCVNSLIKQFIELFDRLQAENERLKGHRKDGFFNLLGNCLVFSKTLKDYNDMRKGLKAEAYKEFAERLKNEYSDFDEKNEVILPENIFKAIDDLLKELVGEDNG